MSRKKHKFELTKANYKAKTPWALRKIGDSILVAGTSGLGLCVFLHETFGASPIYEMYGYVFLVATVVIKFLTNCYKEEEGDSNKKEGNYE